jgi:hypothetical protein
VDSAGWFTPPSGTPHFISADGAVYPKQDTDRQIIYSPSIRLKATRDALRVARRISLN